MASTTPHQLPDWLLYFDSLESTNNYAMQLISDGLAQHGQVVWAKHQTRGKGQRGKSWQDHPENLKFSLIVATKDGRFTPTGFNMLIAVTLVKYLKLLLPKGCSIAAKWPNDIYINDKKACGVLIENTYSGQTWQYAVVGVGLNTNQGKFPEDLRQATSLRIESGNQTFDFMEIITDFRQGLLNALRQNKFMENYPVAEYNRYLYKKGHSILFRDRENGNKFEAFVEEVDSDGKLILLLPTGIRSFNFGSLEWLIS